jgi:hypothetical protein
MHIKLYKYARLMAFCLLFSSQAYGANSFIEYSKMTHSSTLGDVNTLGFYTIFDHQQYVQSYVGIDLALFEIGAATNSHMSTRVLIGISGVGPIAPYADIGTGLLDVLFGGNNNSQDCNQQNNCDPDFYFRAGVRANVSQHIAIGVFYEGVRFGNTQTDLTGSHGYTGVNIGVRY